MATANSIQMVAVKVNAPTASRRRGPRDGGAATAKIATVTGEVHICRVDFLTFETFKTNQQLSGLSPCIWVTFLRSFRIRFLLFVCSVDDCYLLSSL